jgi:hypothetical protein
MPLEIHVLKLNESEGISAEHYLQRMGADIQTLLD